VIGGPSSNAPSTDRRNSTSRPIDDPEIEGSTVPPHSEDGLARDRLAVEHDAPGRLR
jgi:hypothetical protein